MRGTQTRGALLRAGRRVLEQRGLHNTRIADIAAEAKVSVGSFYLQFENKEDLFRQLLIGVEDEVYGELVPVTPGSVNPAQRVAESNHLYLTAFRRNAAFWKVIEEASLLYPDTSAVLAERRTYYRSRSERAIRRWQVAGLIDLKLDPAVAASLLGAMTERLAYIWFVFNSSANIDIDIATDHLTTLWLNVLNVVDST